jgi:hypothetical protein
MFKSAAATYSPNKTYVNFEKAVFKTITVGAALIPM